MLNTVSPIVMSWQASVTASPSRYVGSATRFSDPAGVDVFTRQAAPPLASPMRHPFRSPVRSLGQLVQLRFGRSYAEDTYGAHVADNQVHFRLWAKEARQVDLVRIAPLTPQEQCDTNRLQDLLDDKQELEFEIDRATEQKVGKPQLYQLTQRWGPLEDEIQALQQLIRPLEKRIDKIIKMESDGEGSFAVQPGAQGNDFQPGMLYMYRLKKHDGSTSKLLPDPRSRYQPEGVHGPSQVMDAKRFHWDDQHWKTPGDIRRLMPYRLHVGTFTPEGTFDATLRKFFDEVLQNGKGIPFNAVELMPVGEFPGKRNWGYDKVNPYAVKSVYGHPDQLRRFVNECHKRGVAVLLDVVYNHLGPEGNYLAEFDRDFLVHSVTDWGDGYNLDNPKAKKYVLDNVKSLIDEFHIDGFRFDMTQAIKTAKDGPVRDDMIRDITWTAYQTKRELFPQNPEIIPIAEDARPFNSITAPHDWHYREPDSHEHLGSGMKAKWNFDFHHAVQSLVTGWSHMGGSTHAAGLAHIIRRGFKDSDLFHLEKAVNFSQSHDEIGNWDGQRIYEKVGPRKSRFANTLKYLLPGIPLLFAGEEFGATSRFNFFVNPSDPQLIKDTNDSHRHRRSPQPRWTLKRAFEASKLDWKRQDKGHLQLYKDVVSLRLSVPALWQGNGQEKYVHQFGDYLIVERRGRENPEDKVMILMNCSDKDRVVDPKQPGSGFPVLFPSGQSWTEILNTEASAYGGSGVTNAGKTCHDHTLISLPAWSIAVFRNQPQAK